MLVLDTTTLGIINSLEVDTFYLYEITYDTENPPLRLTNLNTDFTLNGNVYKSFPIQRTELTQSSDGKINDITISIANTNSFIQYYCENYELAGKKIRIIQMFRNAPSYLQFDFVIRSIKTNTKQADFTCGLGFDVFKIKIPKRVIYANFCRWGFKDSNCGYSGSDVACTKTFDECRRKNNLKNFGGFPGVQDTRIFI